MGKNRICWIGGKTQGNTRSRYGYVAIEENKIKGLVLEKI
jgi:hypothetical protein